MILEHEVSPLLQITQVIETMLKSDQELFSERFGAPQNLFRSLEQIWLF